MITLEKVLNELKKKEQRKKDIIENNSILKYCRKKKIARITKRQLYIAHVPGCKNAKITLEKMNYLVENNYASWTRKDIEIKILMC